jgi:hypothetical protein
MSDPSGFRKPIGFDDPLSHWERVGVRAYEHLLF